MKKLFANQHLFKLFLPIIIEQFLEYLVGLADSIMVAYVGESAVSSGCRAVYGKKADGRFKRGIYFNMGMFGTWVLCLLTGLSRQ